MRRTLILAGMVGALALSCAPAFADRGNPAGVTLSDVLNNYGRILTTDPYKQQRRATAQRRLGDLKEEIRRAEDRRWISRREADDLDDRTMRISRFLLRDRNLTDSELKRVNRDLDDIEQDLEHRAGPEHYRSRRGDQWLPDARRGRRDRDRRNSDLDLGNIFGGGIFSRP